MKIGITCYPTYGGSGVVAAELGMELAARGHEIHFISYALPVRLDPAKQNVFFHEVEITNYPFFEHAPYTLTLAVKLLEVANSARLDLLHMHYAIPHSISALLARYIRLAEYVIGAATGSIVLIVGSSAFHGQGDGSRGSMPLHSF
jgi:L-malate glycosyltransferase